MTAAESADLETNPTAGLVATMSAKSSRAWVEINIICDGAGAAARCSWSTTSKPLSPPRSMSTSVTSGRSSSKHRIASAPHDAAPTTAMPWRSSTVTLIEICSGAVDCGAMAMDQRWGVGISGGSVERGNLTPDREALIYFGSPLGRAEPMPSWSKVRGDGAKGRQEPLGMPHRFKAFHRPFALSGRLMRVLGAIVEIPRLPVGHRPHELAVSNPVAGQFVGHQHARYILQALE